MTIRRFLCVLTMLLMLPWGAYAGLSPRADPGAGARVLTSGPAVGAMVGPSEMRDRPPAEASVHRRCRIASLPGSPCGPDRVLAADGPALEGRTRPKPPCPAGPVAVRPVTASPPRQPPRLS